MTIARKTAITAALMHATQSMSTDIYLVAMPLIGKEFNAPLIAVQATMIAFVLGLAATHLFIGSLADYYGRKPVAIAGLCLYLCATLASFFSPSLDFLIIARFFQGMATASGPILMRAIVRDSVTPQETPQVFSKMGVMAAFGPILAPIAGSIALELGGWRACFITLIIYSSIVLACVLFLLRETLPQQNKASKPFSNPFYALKTLTASRDFRIGALLIYCGYGGLYAWLSTSSFILIEKLGYSVKETGFTLGFCACWFFAGSVIANRTLASLGMKKLMIYAGLMGLMSNLVSAFIMTQSPSLPTFLLTLIPFYVAWGIVQPVSMGVAMRPFAKIAGQASAWFGIVQFLGAASVALIAGVFGGGIYTFLVMACTMAAIFCIGVRFNVT